MSDAHQRENTETTEQDRAIALSISIGVGMLIISSVAFYVMSADDTPATLATTAAKDTANTKVSEVTTAPVSTKVAPVVSIEVAAIDGGNIYAAQCQACHQAEGNGIPGVFPTLKNTEWVTGDPRVLAGILLAGYTGSLEVSGQTFNGVMPAFGDKLNDVEIAAVLSYLRTHMNKEAAIEASVVASVRSQISGGPFTNPDDLKALAKP